MIPRSLRFAASLLIAAALLSGTVSACTDSDGDRRAASSTAPATTAPGTTATSSPDPAYRSWIANVKPTVTSIVVHDAPGGAQLQLDTKGTGAVVPVAIDNPLPSGAPTTFLVRTRDVAADDGSRWHEVYLPVRPNEATGFVSDADVVLTRTDMSAEVNLSEHRLDLSDEGSVVATFAIAAGLPDTPTPTGTYYVKELVEPPSANGTYGPYAYGLSAFSPTLVDTQAFADGVIGIHGTNEPDLVGTDVSHGCMRMRNEDILDLKSHEVPLGMPVTITA